ncbi:hypothetical protein [Kribbella jiaozuonensis]|uniref:Uncharacterized protein n=1 Tax=Kribbella jiaozuonensis TaxID=2575441 RepID=A0A4U3M395_9ACTN|nr:hypothetical protein [Kribbella jiaozuonensis]TKK82820.1 hypothetical protein FDA38_08695 [Kribbella jiaozuonensis]
MAAVARCIDMLEGHLGKSWPRKQVERRGWLPNELLMLGHHVAALPAFLTFALRVDSVTVEPTFEEVLQDLKRGVDTATWRHVLLQLEVSRAWEAASETITFEPRIADAPRKADLRIRASRTFLVETTSLSRSMADRRWEELEHSLWMRIQSIQARTGALIDVEMAVDVAPDALEAWLIEVERVASKTSQDRPTIVTSDVGQASIRRDQNNDPGSTFHGSLRTTDGWFRLARTLVDKARQSSGEEPVWLRVDALDGFFQLTEWPSLSWPERVSRLSEATHYALEGADHLAGLVLSSSKGVAIGATNATQVDNRFDAESGTGLRRLIAPHVARETAIIPLNPAADAEHRVWADAYSAEPDWLDEDLGLAGMPPLAEFVR